MNADLWADLLYGRRSLTQIPIDSYHEWLHRFPASFVGHVLWLMRLKAEGSPLYEEALHHASLRASSRSGLKHFLEQYKQAAEWELVHAAEASGEISSQPPPTEEITGEDYMMPAGEQVALHVLEEEFVEKSSFELQEELIVLNETVGGGAEYVPTDFLEQEAMPGENNLQPSVPEEAATVVLLAAQQEHQPDTSAKTEAAESTLFTINENVTAPGVFLPDKVMPFHQWLRHFQFSKPHDQPQEQARENRPAQPGSGIASSQEEWQEIDRFLAASSLPLAPAAEVSVEELARKSSQLSEEIVSETLASIYEEQGLWEKAIRQYVKLSLKFPEKVSFFASRIRALKQKK